MIELHQMLHGYKLGHNYVQGSILLPSSHDMDKIATLSDWSEFVDKDGDRDYITAYPLFESPFYVIAKSWYADEMHRPGCVWTHSLLIQRKDLGKITDYRQLLTLFKRPAVVDEDFSAYSKSIALNEKSIYLKSKGYFCVTEAFRYRNNGFRRYCIWTCRIFTNVCYICSHSRNYSCYR